MLKQFTINRILVLFSAIAFAFFCIDSLIEHWSILNDELLSYIPVVFSGIAALMTFSGGIRWKESCIKMLKVVFICSFLVAATGLYLHILEEEDDEDATEEQIEHEQKEKDKPPLAPLAFGGIAVVGVIATARKWKADVVE